jgi:ribonucleoside-diphosphate reductase beta chain
VLGEPFRKVFDEALVEAHDRLRREPGNREAKVDFVTVYHMIIEGTLGITASHFLLDFLERRGLLPGFADGYGRIAADEQRHIAYGTWFLREAVRDDDRSADTVRQTLRDLLPAAAESLKTPEGADAGALGASTDELRAFALSGLSRRLAIIGVPLDSL